MIWMFLFLLVFGEHTASAQEPAVKHPNLFLNPEEIDRVKAKIRQHEWAEHLFERVKEMAEHPPENIPVENNALHKALTYVLTGDKRFAADVRSTLVNTARYWLPKYEELELKLQPEFGAWTHLATWAWAYDLTYDAFSDEERRLTENWLRTAAKTIIEGEKLWTTTPNLVFDKHWRVAIVGYCLGDKELIEWGLNDPGAHGPHRGGFYQVLDSMIKDGHFWGEAPIYALHYDVHGMLALAEAALHYDATDLYHYVSKKSGASIKSIIDGYLLMSYPLEKTGIEGGSVRMATFGDGSTSYSPTGELSDTFLVNPVSGRLVEPTLTGELELAYKRYQDPGYAWLLSLNPKRDSYIGYGRAVWGYIALAHGEPLPDNPTPPSAPSGIYPSQGFVMLRAEESPRYWTSGVLTAVLRLGASLGHGHEDYYSLILHGKGRLLYPDLNVIQYEPTSLNWTHEGIAHSTLLVDQESPRPGDFTTRHDFTADAKFFAIQGSAFENVSQSRSLWLTKDYLVDVFQAADTQGKERAFDWTLHGLGRLHPGNPAAYRPTDALVPFYWWIDNERGHTTDVTWQVDWVQKSAGVTPGVQRFGKEWLEQAVGVRMTMLGVKGSEVFLGDGPITDGPPYHRLDGNPEGSSPMVVVRRQAQKTIFAAVHEPYEKSPTIRQVRRIQETDDAIGIIIESDTFSDCLLLAFDSDNDYTLRSDNGEGFSFRDYGYMRLTDDQIIVRGKVKAFRLRMPKSKGMSVIVNDSQVSVQYETGFLAFGRLPENANSSSTNQSPHDEPLEHRAWLHYYFLPEEMHLKAGEEKEMAMHIRCVGRGEAEGRLRFLTTRGITVEPNLVDIAHMSEGDEKVVKLRVKAESDAANALHLVEIEAVDESPAASGTLLVSVGVVITEDKKIPRTSQFVIRAPGYTMKVDHFSGVSYYLLDAEGHRRHGRMHNTNFINGIPAVMRDGKWSFHYRHPCRFIWEGKNTLTVGCEGTYNDHDVRLQYTFHEDRIVIALVPPTNPTLEHTVWLGNFDALGKPNHNGEQKASHEPIVADWFFFPHPAYRQGVLLLLPSKTPLRYLGSSVYFPLRVGQEVSLQFATEEEFRATHPR